ncbi:MAG TPA: amino acid adenylation domain-containing protein [Acidimicrobiales bacterium]
MSPEVPEPNIRSRLRELTPERRAELVRQLKERGQATPHRRPPGSPPVLSYEQERLWLLDQLTPGLTAYNASRVLRLVGPLDVAVLQRALDAVVARHEVLRTQVRAVEGEAAPSIGPPRPVTLEVVPAPDGSRRTSEDAVDRIREFLVQPFDLANDLLLRAQLVGLGPDEHILALCVHHLASDGGSRQLLLDELGAYYVGFATGAPEPLLEEPALQFSDVAAWQREALSERRLDAAREFWVDYLAGAPPTIDLPFDRARPAAQVYTGERLTTRVGGASVTALRALVRSEGSTPFMGMVAVFSALLSRLSGQHDLVLGTPVNGRTVPELDQVMGMFSDTLPLRIDVTGDPTLTSLIQGVRSSVGSAFAHREVPFEKIVELVRPTRDPSRPPLVQVLINSVGSRDAEDTAWGALDVSPLSIDPHTSQVDLSLAIVDREQSGELELVWEWCTALWDADSIGRMARQFETLLDGAVSAPEQPLSQLPLVGGAERDQLLAFATSTRREVPPTCVPDLVSAQAVARPDAIVVSAHDGTMTFAELDDRSEALAARLGTLGVGAGDRVAVCLDRSTALITAIIGIMKSGAAYVPIEPSYPADRIGYILADAGARAVLTSDAIRADLPVSEIEVLFVEDGDAGGTRLPGAGPSPRDVAYVIYTSGSTGKPKGVMIEHGNLANLLASMAEDPGLGPGEVMVGITTPAFDLSVPDLFLPLVTGATLVLATPDTARDPVALAALIDDSGADLLQATPTTWQMLLESGWRGRPGLRTVCGGEGYGAALVAALAPKVAGLWNFYGPTEATVWSVSTRLDATVGDPIPMGRPLPNYSCFVLDDRHQLVPVGIVGELYIGGDGLARGYLERPDLTAERFVTLTLDDGTERRLYRTGDLVRWRTDGQLVFVGRADHQVKLRGFRIELGEIESVLADGPGVARCAVVVREDSPGDRRLVAYVVLSDETVDTGRLVDHLRGRLPTYMVPAAIVPLEVLPLNANGKLDRAALPVPVSDHRPAARSVPPTGPTEETLAAIWADLIGTTGIGSDDDFFDLGGHSLLATRLVARIAAQLQVEVPLATLFEHPVLGRFAEAVDALAASGQGATRLPPARRADRERHRIDPDTLAEDSPDVLAAALGQASDGNGSLVLFPASYAQERMWVLEELEPGRALYNVPVARRIVGALDVEALAGAVQSLATAHEVLRTSLVNTDGFVAQVIHRHVDVPFTILDVSDQDDPRASAEAAVAADALRPFDLATAPLARAVLVRVSSGDGPPPSGGSASPDEWMFCLTAHHAVIDGASIEVLLGELRADYTARANGGPGVGDAPSAGVASTLDYGDFALWQRSPELAELEKSDLDFWRDHLQDAPVSLDFPFDHVRPALQSHRGGRRFLRLDPDVATGLRRTARDRSATLFMVALAGWYALLSRYSGQDDVVVGIPVSGRLRPEFDPVVGLFVNTLPLRVSLVDDPTFADLVQRVRSALLDGMSHQSVPFERIVDAVDDQRDLSRHPVFQVLATMQADQPIAEPFGGAEAVRVPIDWGWSRFTDLSLVVMEHDGGIDVGLEYSGDLLDASTAERLCRHLEGLLASGTASPDVPISALGFGEEELGTILDRWSRGPAPADADTRCLHEVFARRAARSPDAVAIEFEGHRLSYGELDARANQLAHGLQARAVGRGSVVAIALDRSVDLVVAVLAVLKAGGAYLPLDVGLPDERLEFMLRDAAVTTVVTTRDVAPRVSGGVSGGAYEALCLDDAADQLDRLPSTPPPSDTGPGDLAYVIYTSGSTGYPKGVLIEHAGVVNLAAAAADDFGIGADSRLLQFATPSFDASVLEIFTTLLFGGTLCLTTREVIASVDDLLAFLDAERITVALLPPSLLTVLPDAELPHLRTILSGAEALSPAVARKWSRPGRSLFNLYGPTEATVAATWQLIEVDAGDNESLPIGRPIRGVETYVLDAALRPVPVGCPGELFIGGIGVGRGYLDRPELTAERFVAHPFSAEPEARVYRTGDGVRWLENGTLEYRGRFDDQVKLRGFRIELGEIEQTLMRHERIRDAAAVIREDGDRQLVAYVVCTGNDELTYDEVRTHLRRTLPDYMVPSAVVTLDALPLAANQFKVDRRALPAPPLRASRTTEFLAPSGPVEELVAGVWCDVLAIERIGATDNVFELGGNSLDAARVVSKLRSQALDLSLRSIFDGPTVQAMAREILEGLAAGAPSDLDDLLDSAEGSQP